MKVSPDVGAVIINHNSNGTVLTAIRALKSQTRTAASILVVDNCSSDQSPAQIEAEFGDVCLARLEENIGLSRARNLGISQLKNDLVLLIDDDVYLDEHAVARLVAARERTGATVVCPRIVFHATPDTIQCDGAAIHFAGMLMLTNAGGQASISHEAFPTRGFIGACLLLDRSALLALGGFDEDYFFYFEDMELSYRLLALGHTVVCEPNAVAFHDRGGGTAGLSFRGSGRYPARRAYYVLRHRWLTILLHYRVKSLILLAPALLMVELASLAESVRRGWILPWLHASFWISRNLPGILKRRGKWRAMRRVGDREILQGGPLPFSAGFIQTRFASVLASRLDSAVNRYWQWARRWL